MTENITINSDRKLYVIPAGKGFSCLGFGVCADRSLAIAKWINRNGGSVSESAAEFGTIEAYQRYQELLRIADGICREKRIRCDIELTQQLIGLEGKRVEIEDKYGDVRRFIVGKSIGWMPIHLEIKTKRSSGGCAVCGAPFRSVRVVS